MSEQGSEQSNGNGADAAPAEQTPSSGESKAIEASGAQIEQLMAKIKELESDNYKYRQERKSKKQQEAEAMKKAGEFEPLLQEREAQISELQSKLDGLSESAQQWERYQAAEAAAIEAEAAELSEESRADLAQVSDLGARRRLLNQLRGPQQKPRAQETPVAPPAGGSTDFTALSGDSLVEAINRDPEGWQAHVSAQQARPMTDYQRRALRTKK